MIMSFELTKPGLWLLYTQDYVTMPHVELQPLEKQASHTNANVSTGGNTSPKTNHTSTHISTQSCIFFLVYGRGCPSSCSCKHEQDPIFLLSQDARLPCCLTFPHTAVFLHPSSWSLFSCAKISILSSKAVFSSTFRFLLLHKRWP